MTRTVATIEARMNSSRLPGKVLAPIQGKPCLELMIERLRCAPSLDGIVVATTDRPDDNAIASLARHLDVACWRGSEDDVLERVRRAAHANDIGVIVELTGDCPLIDPDIVETVIASYRHLQPDYCANTLQRSYPIGMDTQVFSRAVLDDVAQRTDDPHDHEHVSLFIYNNPQIYRLHNVPAPTELNRPELRLTLDTRQDLEAIGSIFDALYPANPAFRLQEVLQLLDVRPEIVAINAKVPHRHV